MNEFVSLDSRSSRCVLGNFRVHHCNADTTRRKYVMCASSVRAVNFY